MTTFQGISPAAFGFYAELQAHNNREWWLENSARYRSLVREPLLGLLAGLEPRFGPGKVFRPQWDMRFFQNGPPYKTAQGAFASVQEGLGYYLHIGADGFAVGAGCHTVSPAQLGRYRNSVDAAGTGEALRHIVGALEAAGFELEGDTLRNVPRGFPADHPRADLLRYRTLAAGKDLGRPDWLATPAAAQETALQWDALRPLVEWMGRHAAP